MKKSYLLLQNGGSSSKTKPYLTITDDMLDKIDTIKPMGMIKRILANNNINVDQGGQEHISPF